ncbi:hypothetical protein ABIA54_004835 [Pseudomonas sp. EB276 TE3739]|uniref:hypothetical protein n=1 Tax=Pseudomonas TaxID=286 RepID=UPI0020A0D943|nr:hypothetical protein [Pseudomonas koreensis]MCP1476319.1 hypothetical protein [Pseudomonas koreensis]
MPNPNSPLLLKELDIPGRSKEPVSKDPDIWGINIAAALGNFPLNGLLCQAGPWGNMAVGDKLTIFWGTGQNVWVETVDKTEVGSQLRMFVPSRHMVDGSFAVSYVVKPLGGADQASEVMQVLVKLTRPGGHDDNGEIGHSKLIMTIPEDIVDGGIHKDNVAAGVPITLGKTDGTAPYPYAAAGDVGRISWGGIFVLSEPLTQEQAEGKAPIIVTITEAIIREAGDADFPGVAVAFEVYDKVLNRSEDWSPEQRVVVAVDATRLDAPMLKEAKNNELDLDALAGKPGTAQVPTSKSEFELGDIIIVRVKGTPTEGAPIDFNVESKPLDNLPSVVELELPNAALMQLATKTFSLSCSVKKADSPPHLHSKSQFIRAIGEVQRLAAPIMLDEDSGALDPALPQIRLEIPFDKSFAQGQVLKIFMLGTRSDLKPYLPDLPTRLITRNDVVDAKPLLYNIDGKHLAPVNGGTAEFYYQQLIAEAVLATLNPYEATRAIRESIHTEILQIGEPRLELPEPEVAGVVNGVLPADTAGTTLTVVYTETVSGDEVFMFWIGSITGEYPNSIKLNEFTAGQRVPFPIPAAVIKGNEGGTVEARYEIKRAAGGTSYSNSLTFSVGVALDLKEPKIKEAPNDTSLDPFAAQNTLTAVIDYDGMLLDDKIIVTWNGAPGTPTEGSHTTDPWPVTALGQQEIALDKKVIAFNLGKPVTVSYTVTRGTTEPKDSRPRLLAVLPIQNGDSRLPKATIDGAPDNELDVTILANNAFTRVPTWLLIAANQKLWLRYFGTNDDNSEYRKTTYAGQTLYGNGVIVGPYPSTPVSELRGLKDKSTLTIAFKVTFDGSINEENAVVFPDRVYTVKAVEDVKPAITSVKDSKGAEIVHSGGTVDPVVTLTGSAARNQQVEIFEGAASKGKHPVDGTGTWKYTATLAAIGTRTFKAKADYGTGQESVGRTFTYSSVLTPVITSVQDSKGAEIPNNTVTLDPNIKLTGTATSRLYVEIFDEATSKGRAQVSGSTGKWELEVKDLSLTVHNFKAKALYGTEPVSAVRTLTVTAVIVPTLDKVLDDTGADIPDNYTTESTTLKLQGTASIGQQVDIFEGSEPSAEFKGTATADAAGSWEHPIIVPLGARRLYAQSRYHSGTVHSNIRTLKVVPKDLYVDNFGPNTEYRDGETRHFEKINVTRVNISGTSNMWARDLLNSSPNVGEVKMVIGFKGRTFKLLKFHCLCWSPRLNQGPPVITGVLVRIDFFNGTELVHQYNINGDAGLWREITIKLLGGLSFDSVEIRLFPAKNLHFSSILINWIFCTNDV